MRNSKQAMLLTALALLDITGCSTNDYVDHSDEEIKREVPLAFSSIEHLSIELLDEVRLLAKTRSAKAIVSKPIEQREAEIALSTYTYDGFDQNTSFICDCEVTTIIESVAERVGYGKERVFVYGTKPPGGVMVNVDIQNKPLQSILNIIDASKGSHVDIAVNPDIRTIVIRYLETN